MSDMAFNLLVFILFNRTYKRERRLWSQNNAVCDLCKPGYYLSSGNCLLCTTMYYYPGGQSPRANCAANSCPYSDTTKKGGTNNVDDRKYYMWWFNATSDRTSFQVNCARGLTPAFFIHI